MTFDRNLMFTGKKWKFQEEKTNLSNHESQTSDKSDKVEVDQDKTERPTGIFSHKKYSL